MTACISCIQGLGCIQRQEEYTERTRDNTHIPDLESNLESHDAQETSGVLPRWAQGLCEVLGRVGYAAVGLALGGLSIVLVPALALIALPIGIGGVFFVSRTHGDGDGLGIGLGMLLMGVFSPVIGAGYLLREAVS